MSWKKVLDDDGNVCFSKENCIFIMKFEFSKSFISMSMDKVVGFRMIIDLY